MGHAYSALNLRLAFALFGLVSSAVLGWLSFQAGLAALGIFLLVLAAAALVNVVVVQRRRAARKREQPGVRHSLFE